MVAALLAACVLPGGQTGPRPVVDAVGTAVPAVTADQPGATATPPTSGPGTGIPDTGSSGAERSGTGSTSPAPEAGIPAPGAGYAWPLLPAPAVLTPFQAPTQPYGPGHRGVDLAGRARQPVLAARGGTVVFAGPVAGHGVVSVQHDDGLRTTYEPVSPTVTAGAVVRAGDVLGLLDGGHAGCPEAVCLHWGVRRGRLDYLDPLVLLRPARVRLLPVPDPWPDGASGRNRGG